jgi:hypothetical protein
MLVYSTQAAPDCRSVVVPACEPDLKAEQGSDIPALACFQLRLRDQIDFKVDFSQWLLANGNAQLSSAQFAVATGSPGTPTIVGQAFSPAGKCAVVLAAANNAKAGDAYWLDLTATVAAVPAVGATDVAIPARTIVRRIHVVVANG